MENKQKNVKTMKVTKYAAIAAAAVGLGYLLGNKETRNKIGSSINKLTALKAVELETREEKPAEKEKSAE